MPPSPIVPVFLAGGAGTRLWPVSRDALPKQFLPLVGELSTYQQALLRVADRERFAAPIVMTGGISISSRATRPRNAGSMPGS